VKYSDDLLRSSTRSAGGTRAPREQEVIDVRIRELRQFFDSMDPSPFRDKDLDPKAEAYIVDSLKELPSRAPCVLRIRLEQSTGLPDIERYAGEAVHVHFARRSDSATRDLHDLLRRGGISLVIGVAFLATLLALSALIDRWMAPSETAAIVKESLLIAGWVAMWRPLEIFLYDWWPIVGDRRVFRRLSRIDVRVVEEGEI
jgi:hypothetical protein